MQKFTLDTWDPTKESDKQLTSDFWSLAKIYSIAKAGRETEFKDTEEVIKAAVRILKEIYLNGKMDFQAKDMSPDVLELMQKSLPSVIKDKIIRENADLFASGEESTFTHGRKLDFTGPKVLIDRDGKQYGWIRFKEATKGEDNTWIYAVRDFIPAPGNRVAKQERTVHAILKEVDLSVSEDKIIPGRFFILAEPSDGYSAGEEQSQENFLSRFDETDFPVLSSKKYCGINLAISKEGNSVTAIMPDGQQANLGGAIGDRIREEIKPESAIFLCVLELWDADGRLTAEAIQPWMEQEQKPSGFFPVLNIYDLVYLNGDDIHGQPFMQRNSKLKELGPRQSTIYEPVQDELFNITPSFLSTNKKALAENMDRLCHTPGSTGMIAKIGAAPYDLSGKRNGMIKFNNSATLKAVILERMETEHPNLYSYALGIPFAGKTPGKGDKSDLLCIGTTFSDAEIEPGKFAKVEYEGMELCHNPPEPGKITISLYAPRIVEMAMEADEIPSAVESARNAQILDEKIIQKDGKAVRKQDDLLVYPGEEKKWRFVIQHHYRGKSAHADFRGEHADRLIGFTMFDMIPDAIKKPVLTLDDAKKADNSEAFKVNWGKGEFRLRESAGGGVRPADVRSVPKEAESKEWLDKEGIIKPGNIGSTENFPGVLSILDQGEIEYGAQKPFFHEYFLSGKKIRGRLIFRKLTQKEAESKKADAVLSPGEKDEKESGELWVAMQPIDQTPNVLSVSAIEKNWMPPQGVSALPKNMRDAVPENLRYWTMQDRAKALDARRKLSEMESLGGIGINKKDSISKIELRTKFCKIDNDKRLVYGIVYEAGPVDTQGEYTDEEELEKAAHRFMEQVGGTNEMHQDSLTRREAVPVESCVLRPGDVFKGVHFDYPTWVVGTKIYSDSVWKKIKEGEYTGYSMEGDSIPVITF